MKYTKEYFTNLAEEISRFGSNPTVIKNMIEVRNAPEDERIALSTKIYPEEMRKLNIDIPDSIRISPRTFEKPEFSKQLGIQNPGREPGSTADSSWDSYGSMPDEAYDTSAWGEGSDDLPEQSESPEVIRQTIYQAVEAISAVVLEPNFKQTMIELYDLPEEKRAEFVLSTFLEEKELKRRGIKIPESMTIQRSTFYDGRPTLFCITKKESKSYPWRKITITFDNEVADRV